jgi:hypothetical protein
MQQAASEDERASVHKALLYVLLMYIMLARNQLNHEHSYCTKCILMYLTTTVQYTAENERLP